MMLSQHLVLLGATLLTLFEKRISVSKEPRLNPFDPSLGIVFFRIVPGRVVCQLFIDALCARVRVTRQKKEKGIFTTG